MFYVFILKTRIHMFWRSFEMLEIKVVQNALKVVWGLVVLCFQEGPYSISAVKRSKLKEIFFLNKCRYFTFHYPLYF